MLLRILFFIALVHCTAAVSAQLSADTTVQRLYGAQVGFLGAWGYGEFPLGDQWVLRADAGLDGAVRGGSFFYRTTFVLAPSLRLEPRWYYNFKARAQRGRRTAGNAANYFSLPLIAYPGLFRIASEESVRVDRGLHLLPTWGMRRQLGQQLYYELGLGLGYGVRWAEDSNRRTGGTTGWVRLRIGI
jgi:hypothetical protein